MTTLGIRLKTTKYPEIKAIFGVMNIETRQTVNKTPEIPPHKTRFSAPC